MSKAAKGGDFFFVVRWGGGTLAAQLSSSLCLAQGLRAPACWPRPYIYLRGMDG